MPPKSKGSSKKPPKPRTATLINGLTKEEMSKEQMVEHIVHLREELDREREERNYFQLERDKVHTFWEVTERHLEEAKAELKNLDQETEEAEQRHQVEIKVYKQKMKHLLCEHQNMVSELKADELKSTEMMHKEQAHLESELRKRMDNIRDDMTELDTENLIKELELTHKEEMIKTRNNWKEQLTEIQAKYGKKLDLLRQELDNKRKSEISEREDQWNSRISSLINDHDKIFSDNVTLLNRNVEQDLALEESLKKQIEDMKVKQKEKERDLADVLPDNEHLSDLLLKVTEETADIQKNMKHPIRKKDPNEKVKLNELKDQKLDYELLQQKFGQLQLERDDLYKTFTRSVETVQQEAERKNALLETNLKSVTENVEKAQARLSSVLRASNMDPTALSGITNKIEDIIDSSNAYIKDLLHKRAQISQACLDVSVEELCVKQPRSATFGKEAESS